MASVRKLQTLDWLNRFEFISQTDPRVSQIAPDLTREELGKAVYCVGNCGKITRAAKCFRFIGLRMPLLFPIALILWIPGMLWSAEKIYEWIARNREFLSHVFRTSRN